MSRCAGRARRWCCCTASPRRVGSGGPSGTALAGVAHPGRARPARPRRFRRGAGRPAGDGRPRGRGGRDDRRRRAVCDLLGYSLGARVALHVVDRRPNLPLAMPSSSASPPALRTPRSVTAGGAVRRCRWPTSSRPRATSRPSSTRWLRGPLFERLPRLRPRHDAERLRNSAAGLASSLRLCGTGTQEPLWDRLGDPPLPRPGPGGIGRHPLRRATPCGWPASPATRSRRWSRAAAMPSIWPSPTGLAGSCITGSTVPGPGCERQRTSQSRPTVRSAPTTIWSRAVAPSIGSSGRPFLSLERQPHRDDGQRERQERQQRPRPVVRAGPRWKRRAHQREAVEAGPRCAGPSRTASVFFPDSVSVAMSRRLFACEQGSGQQTDRHPGPEHEPPVVVCRTNRCPPNETTNGACWT